MKRKDLFLSAVLAVTASSCGREASDIIPVESDEVRVVAALPDTRATSDGFEPGDCMGVFAVEYDGGVPAPLQIGGNWLNNEPFVCDGAVWTASRKVYWSDSACDFYAVYPYCRLNSIDAQLFEIATDQTTTKTSESLSGYEASDLMWAKSENVTRSDGSVVLQFRHLMSRVVVKIVKGDKFEGNLPEDISVHIYNTVTSASVNIASGSLEKNPYGTKNTISAKRLSADTFAAIVVPQNLERRTPLIEVSMGGIAYLLDYSVSFRPGYQHIVQVIVNTSPDQEKVEISIDGTIQDW